MTNTSRITGQLCGHDFIQGKLLYTGDLIEEGGEGWVSVSIVFALVKGLAADPPWSDVWTNTRNCTSATVPKTQI